MESVPERRTVYRYYDAADRLLYVGCTQDVKKRSVQHRYHSPWWKEAAKVTLAEFDCERDALAAEQDAIQRESPRFNVMHSLLPRVIAGSPEIAEQIRNARSFDDFLTLKQAAEMFNRKIGTLRMHVRTGVLRACMVSSTWMTSKDEMRRYVSVTASGMGRRNRPEPSLPPQRPDCLTEREWDILVMRKAGMTLQQIAGGLGVTRERVRQLEAKASRSLATPPQEGA